MSLTIYRQLAHSKVTRRNSRRAKTRTADDIPTADITKRKTWRSEMEIDTEQRGEGSSFAEKMADETRPRRVVFKRTIACIPTPIPLAGAPGAAVLRSRIHRQNVVSHRVVTSLNEFAKEFVQHGSRSIVSRPFEFRSTVRFSSRFLFSALALAYLSLCFVFDRVSRIASASNVHCAKTLARCRKEFVQRNTLVSFHFG